MILVMFLGVLLTIALVLLGLREFAASAAGRRQAVAGAETLDGDRPGGSLVDELDARLRRMRVGRWVERELDLAGVRRRPIVVLSAAAAVALVSTYIIWKLLAPLLAVLGLVAGYLAIRWYLRREQARRTEAFVGQLPELARVLANASYAGLSLPTAIGIAGEELAEPAHTELSRVATRLKFGAPLATALDELRGRVGSREVGVLISTLVVASRSGGSLVTALRSIADTLEQRKETRREIQTVLAQVVATSYIVVFMGVVILLMLNAFNSGTVAKMTTEFIGQLALAVSGLLFGGGFLMIRRMTRIDL